VHAQEQRAAIDAIGQDTADQQHRERRHFDQARAKPTWSAGCSRMPTSIHVIETLQADRSHHRLELVR
jgi:hypothetical protein